MVGVCKKSNEINTSQIVDEIEVPKYYLKELERVKSVALDDQRDARFSAL